MIHTLRIFGASQASATERERGIALLQATRGSLRSPTELASLANRARFARQRGGRRNPQIVWENSPRCLQETPKSLKHSPSTSKWLPGLQKRLPRPRKWLPVAPKAPKTAPKDPKMTTTWPQRPSKNRPRVPKMSSRTPPRAHLVKNNNFNTFFNGFQTPKASQIPLKSLPKST